MDQQLTFADSEFSHKRRQTRKEKFLGRMDKLIPCEKGVRVTTPSYPLRCLERSWHWVLDQA